VCSSLAPGVKVIVSWIDPQQALRLTIGLGDNPSPPSS
jgi:hypothetical protein